MWLMSKTGFVSIVEHRDRPGFVLVRARRMGDLDPFIEDNQKYIKEQQGEVVYLEHADYPYRVVLPKGGVVDTVSRLIRGIDYDNFKASLPPDRQVLYGQVWWVLQGLEM